MSWRAPMILTLTNVPANFTVVLPLNGITGDFQVDWGDSVINTNLKTHTYSTSGTYTIQISVYSDNISKITIFGTSGFSWNGNQYLSAINAWGDFNGITTLNFIGGGALTSVPITVPNTVTNMSNMFAYASNFNQDIGNWDVGQVTNMSGMFNDAFSFNQNLNNWNVSQVTNMFFMFAGDESFNGDIGNWNVGQVTNMSYMFAQASSFNKDIGDWDVGKVTNMFDMFVGASSFNQGLSEWDVSQVTNMSGMFAYASSFNKALNNWNVGKVTNMGYMFNNASSFNQDIGNWDVGLVTNMTFMFYGTSLNTTNYSNILIGWNALPNLQSSVVFWGGVSIYQYATTAYNELLSTYNWSITPIPTILDLPPMILTLTNVPAGFTVELPLDGVTGDFQVNWDDSVINTNTTTHTYSNSGTYTIQISVYNDNISKITTFGEVGVSWIGSQYLTAINSWGDFNGITTLNFIGGGALTSVPITVPNTVTDMAFMFKGATSFNQDISNWNVGQVSNMILMFYGASSFNQDIGNWDVGQVTDMGYMFYDARSFNQDIGNWNVGQVTDISFMFYGASSFNQDISNWNVNQVTDMGYMFTGTSLNTTNYSNILIGWNALPNLQSNVVFGGGDSIYQYATTAYNELLSTYNWSITPIPTILPDVKPVNPVIAKKKSFFGGNTFDSSNTNASRYSQIVRGINNGTTRFINNDLNAFGYYSGGPGGSGAPPRNKF